MDDCEESTLTCEAKSRSRTQMMELLQAEMECVS